jgi:hypothetical protein
MAMAKHRWLIGGFVAALALAGTAQAQPGDVRQNSALAPTSITLGQPRSDDDIVVTGKTEAKPAEIREQARAITRQSAKYNYPLAMFQSRVCPGIVGMPPAMADILVDRIRFNAERVGLSTAPLGKCDANILVIFVRNGHGVIQDLAKKPDGLLGNIKFADLQELRAETGPVHAWVETEVRSRQGDTIQGDNEWDMTKIPVLNIAQSQSHIFLANRIDINKAVVMIDLRAINGMSVVQLADYVTMRAFAATNPVKGDAAASTILGLFDPEHTAHPRELTDFDLAYLHTVYDGVDSLNATSKLASITRKLKTVQAQGGSAKDDE